METIDILLATYNGSKYLDIQIFSIISQSYTQWKLIIHDDGSNDNTLEIIEKWSKLDSRIIVIRDDSKFGSAAQNFMYLLSFASANFICFCDQDDLWFEYKLEVLCSHIKELDNTVPQVAFSNAYVWSPENGIFGLATLTFPQNLNQLLFLNAGIQGAASIFNRKMLIALLHHRVVPQMHDHLLALLGASLGEISYVNRPLMLYRKHENNVTGSTDYSFWHKFVNALKRKKNPVVCSAHYIGVKAFYNDYLNLLPHADRIVLDAFVKSKYASFYNRIRMVYKLNFSIFGSKLLLMSKIIFRPYYK